MNFDGGGGGEIRTCVKGGRSLLCLDALPRQLEAAAPSLRNIIKSDRHGAHALLFFSRSPPPDEWPLIAAEDVLSALGPTVELISW